MLPKAVEKSLNAQIGHEAFASFFYLTSASWCEMKGYHGSAAFLYAHAEEERMHMMKIVRYVNSMGGHALIPKIDQAPHNFDSLKVVFEKIFAQELMVTEQINELADLSFKNKDFATFNFLQWFIEEQREEEGLFSGILEKFEILGTDGKSIYMIDKYLGKLIAAGGVDVNAGESGSDTEI